MYKLLLLSVIAFCGVNSYILEGAERIVQGQVNNGIQYVISLQDKTQLQSYTRGHRCGGVLITQQHALTTAACTINTNNGVPINQANFRVFAGTILTMDNVNNVRDIASITIHPYYTRHIPFVNDIAVITLQAPFPATISPLPMPIVDVALSGCETSGFGAHNTTATASVQLMTLSGVSLIGFQQCNIMLQTMGGAPIIQVLPSMVCGVANGVGCTGDLGNPLVCNNNQVLTGLLTRSNNCTTLGGVPEVYTRIHEYVPWVNQVIAPPNTTTPAPTTSTAMPPVTVTTPAPGAAFTSRLGTAVALIVLVIQCFSLLS
ncbi:chymotrypsinogen A-like isoform X2 [Spodoptera frugiperda]|uniref:Chymotrypsinogen A-like isoform X1 n=1 Tax=Spodoptera frugiperda TaxID=7108 RepID=A0A9R0EBG9_SPOFR|nr:chymotrypsinogen A-like isoform X1 [Spodoptera frugiperda]XP_050562210.1 chymotrypsinogen A-like isoform X2 [Spodoptera frugiperda]